MTVRKFDTIKNDYDLMSENKSSGIPLVDSKDKNKLVYNLQCKYVSCNEQYILADTGKEFPQS